MGRAVRVSLSKTKADFRRGVDSLDAAGRDDAAADSRVPATDGAAEPGADLAAEIEAPAIAPDAFGTICAMLEARTAIDFTNYRRPALLRRIRHLMRAEGMVDGDVLIGRLRQDPAQVDLLFRDLLIGVTQFLRDATECQFLRNTVLPRILTGKPPNQAVRVWVPGCENGEEVYSLAILLRETMERLQVSYRVQIFGTDVSEAAIARARTGRYAPTALAQLEPEQRARWFKREGADWRVVGAIREMCIFSVHNLVGDVPFSRLDLISCRNLLNDVDAALQAEAMRTFHYALRPAGWLFVGPSESADDHLGSFQQPDRHHRVFQRVDGASWPARTRAFWSTGDPAGTRGGRAAVGGRSADTVRAGGRAIAQELSAIRSQLLETIADRESTNEALRLSNEEYLSTNEELQSANEELEAAKEEMQSVNEELHTVNLELLTRNEQLTLVNNDIQNLLVSTQIATLFLDTGLRIRRFTPAVKALFRLRDTDLDRPITDIVMRLAYRDLTADLNSVVTGSRTVEREVEQPESGKTFLMRMRPYRTLDRVAEGAVVTFVDISDQKRLAEAQHLTQMNQALEARVAERTEALEAASRELTRQTEQRQQAEDMLRQSQKLEAIGKLTGGIAHDFNNLLGAIIGNVEFLMDGVRDDAPRLEQAKEILDSALRGADLTHRLLAFASKQPLNPRVVALDRLLPAQVGMLRRTLGETIAVSLTLAPGLWPTRVDPPQIGEALLNLALNARDAMPHGGKLSIELANLSVEAAVARTIGEIAPGDYVVLSVADTGTGMTQSVIEHATEPFFSTKPSTLGSGLGLSIIYGFVRQSGGCLRIDSVIGRGTTVRLYLPRAQSAPTPPAAPVPPADGASVRGHEAILLVDDNPTLLTVIERHLKALGYGVAVAATGPEAITMLEGGGACDLLFTDIMMPQGMSGYDLADAARRLKPDLKVLFATGYAVDVPVHGDGRSDDLPVLRKPYRLHAVATAVRAALDG